MSSVQHRLLATAFALTFSAGAVAASPPVIEINNASDSRGSFVAGAPSGQSSAELLFIIEQLQSEVRALRGELEQQSFRLKKMERQQLDRYRDLDRRIGTLMERGAQPASGSVLATQPQAPAAVPAAKRPEPVSPQTVSNPPAKPVSPTASAAQPVKNGVSDSKAYRDAFALVRARDYAAAVVAFKAFVRDYPASARVANAHYWMGEIYHAEQKLELAREAFALVLGQFPEHPKAPHAAYKLGVIYSELGDQARSVEYLDYVLKNHPNSNVAPLVEEFKRK